MNASAAAIPIQPPVVDPLAAGGIALIAVVVGAIYVLLLAGGKGRRLFQLAGGAAILFGGSAVAAFSGALARFDLFPPPMLVMIAGVLVLSFAIGLSRLGGEAAASASLAALIGLQSFRLPLELVMHHAFEKGIMPEQLTFTGYNFDITTGAGALLLGIALARGVAVPRWLLWAWNVWGFYCLAAIFAIAIGGSPLVRLFGDEPRNLNTWVLFFPYPWLPVILVTVALSGHLLVTRKLLRD